MEPITENFIIDFGKYRGKSIAAINQIDPGYFSHLASKDWLSSNRPQIFNFVVNNYGPVQDSPDHNTMQNKFTNIGFRRTFLEQLFKENSDKEVKIKAVGAPVFEQHGVDVVFDADVVFAGPNLHSADLGPTEAEEKKFCFLIELKPSISDDAPSVLRNFKAMLERFPATVKDPLGRPHPCGCIICTHLRYSVNFKCVIACREFTAAGLSFRDFRLMCCTSKITALQSKELFDASGAHVDDFGLKRAKA